MRRLAASALVIILSPGLLAQAQRYTAADGKLRVTLAQQPFSPNDTVPGPRRRRTSGEGPRNVANVARRACYHRAALFRQEAVTIESQLVGTTTVLRVHGTLTANVGEPGLRDMIREAVADGVRTVVINLEDATAIDSSGVSDLASGHMALAGAGGALKLCCLTKKLQDVFVITRLNSVFETYDTEAAAVASLNPRE